MNYGYIRVSTREQNIDRQLADMYNLGLNDSNIFIDKQSGKDFERDNYKLLKSKLSSGDLLIIKSIDRLGRNYDMIIKEWRDITKVIEADILVIDFPLLDTRVEANNLVGKFIADIVLQILSFVAQNERENIKKRQAEGIKIAREKGIHLGRPKYVLPDNFNDVATAYYLNKINIRDALSELEMTKSTFYKYYNMYITFAKKDKLWYNFY